VVSKEDLNGYLLKTLKSGEKVYLMKKEEAPEGVEIEEATFEDIFKAIVRGERNDR
jgi:ABC-2 type transport system ATP-binding protein